jgi:hypothetical protein
LHLAEKSDFIASRNLVPERSKRGCTLHEPETLFKMFFRAVMNRDPFLVVSGQRKPGSDAGIKRV